MAYCVISDVRAVLPSILDTDALSDSVITNYIEDADNWVDMELSANYKVPITFSPLPVEITNASKYYSAYLCIDNLLVIGTQYNQDYKAIAENKKKQACYIIENLKNGKYYNSNLVEQLENQSIARLVSFSDESVVTNNNNFIELITSGEFL